MIKLHPFNFTLNSLVRVAGHLSAGYKLLGWKVLKHLGCINSMTTAYNYKKSMWTNKEPLSVIDVGANNSQMIRLIAPDCHNIISFEPNTSLKPKGKVYSVALGNKEAMVDFYLPEDSNWGTTLGDKFGMLPSSKITMYSFKYLAEHGFHCLGILPDPILLKIDTEGTELDVLKGFGEYLEAIEYILVEVTANHNFKEVYSYLYDRGFTKDVILYAAHDGKEIPHYFDILFTREKALSSTSSSEKISASGNQQYVEKRLQNLASPSKT